MKRFAGSRCRDPRERRRRNARAALLAAALAALTALPALPGFPGFLAARGAELQATGPRAVPAPFIFEAQARQALQDLWDESVQWRQERVACLGGYFDGELFHVTRAQRVRLQFADSIRVSPAPSLDECVPPEWSGTAHTHIRGFGWRPLLPTFSGSDRAVMATWRARWRADGLFCVLYSASEAYCEYGQGLSGDAAYSDRVGDPGEEGRRRLPADARPRTSPSP